ncbi:MAG: 2-isopropylmalate synthase [Candidatus Omnitrophica bacterium]|nr:2-isopropylmalate synthase [Candidatus Omnitrophota bacterium]
MRPILINDITLRDGEQAPGVNFYPEEKCRIAEQLLKMNIPIIEAGFAIASDNDFDAIQMISKRFGHKSGPVICSMARATLRDIERAAESVRPAARGRVQVVLGTSDIHLKYKFKKTRNEIKDIAHKTVRYAKTLCADIEFAAEDATRSDIDFLTEVTQIAVAAGATTIELPDTVGYATPHEYAHLVQHIVDHMDPGITVATHCHNDLGLAVANTLFGIMAGASQAEVTINGIGERVGNASAEEVIMALKTRQDYFQIQLDINTKEIMKTSELVEELSAIKVANNKAIVGCNAFRHESGIHQDGLIKNKSTYQIMEPEDIGVKGYGLVLGKLSGRHALQDKIQSFGLTMNDQEFDRFYMAFKDVASKKKFLLEEDLLKLIKKHGYETIK